MPEDARPKLTWRKRLWRWVRLPLLVYTGLCLTMMGLESQLIYPRPGNSASDSWRISQEAQTEVIFEARDGTRLHGWFFAHDDPKHAILYCHGNGENVSHNAGSMSSLRNRLYASIFIFDYRGYGRSDGSPYEAGIILDGLAAQRWLAQQMGMETDEIILMGRSLGGGVAVALAKQQGARALVLQNTFADLSEVAAEKYPFLPVRVLMRNPFPSAERIKGYQGPLLQTHGTADRVIPYRHGRQLFDAAPGEPKLWVDNPGIGHNDALPTSYYTALAEFLESLPE